MRSALVWASLPWAWAKQCPGDGGCCFPYFYCGSNGRCTEQTGPCEDPLFVPDACMGIVSNVQYNLTGLRIATGKSTYLVSSGATTLAFDVCANAVPPPACDANAIAVALAVDDVGGCVRQAGAMAATTPTFSAIDDVDMDPSYGVRIEYADGDYCSEKTNRSLVVDVVCEPTAVATPRNIRIVDLTTCSTHVVLESAFGCPKACSIGESGVCSGRGDCIWSEARGARCDCDRDYAGRACQKSVKSSQTTDFRIATRIWQAVASALVAFTGVSPLNFARF